METFLKLKKKRTSRRIAEGMVVLISLAVLILFFVLRENSKVIVRVDETPIISYDYVTYTKNYSAAILIFGIVLAVSLSVLVSDLLTAKIYYVKIDGEDVIVCGGLFPKLSVNGEEKDSMFRKSCLETKLKSGVTLTITPRPFSSYRIDFSDNRPPIDL